MCNEECPPEIWLFLCKAQLHFYPVQVAVLEKDTKRSHRCERETTSSSLGVGPIYHFGILRSHASLLMVGWSASPEQMLFIQFQR